MIVDIYTAMQFIIDYLDCDNDCFEISTSELGTLVFKFLVNCSMKSSKREMRRISSQWVTLESDDVDNRIRFGDGKSVS